MMIHSFPNDYPKKKLGVAADNHIYSLYKQQFDIS